MRTAIGIDIGGTKILGVLVNEGGKIVRSVRVSTASFGSQMALLEGVCSLIRGLVGVNSIAGIGVGIPGRVRDGKVVFIPNVPMLAGVSITRALRRFGVPVFVQNDGDCFALAEHCYLAGKGMQNIVGVVIGTGVGSGIICEGKLYVGNGFAGEIGHIIVDPSGIVCACGNEGDIESWCSGENIVKHYIHAGGRMKNPDARDIFTRDYDVVAVMVRKQTLEKLAVGLANVVNVLDPEMIVLGGSVSKSLNCNAVQRELKRYAKDSSVRVVKGKLRDEAGAIGAALLALKYTK